MRLYYEIAVRAFRRAATYRGAYLMGMLTNAFFGALITFVYRAVYAGGGTVAGYSLQDAISYNWLTQSLISIGGAWLMMDISQTIASGEVVTDLSRPWNFYSYWLSRSLGERIYNLLVRASFTYLIGVVLFGARVPDLPQALAFLLTLTLAMLVSFSLNFIVNMSAFWMLDANGVIGITNVLLMFFSGFLLPIAFFPPALQTLAAVLPFQAITSLPAQVFIGKISGSALLPALLLQGFWAIVLAVISAVILRAAMQKLVIQGG